MKVAGYGKREILARLESFITAEIELNCLLNSMQYTLRLSLPLNLQIKLHIVTFVNINYWYYLDILVKRRKLSKWYFD